MLVEGKHVVPTKSADDIEREEQFYFDFGNRVSEKREGKHIRQEDLGDAMFRSTNFISKLENGTAHADAYNIKILCDQLGVDANYLLGCQAQDKSNVRIDYKILAKLASLPEKKKEMILKILEIIYPNE